MKRTLLSEDLAAVADTIKSREGAGLELPAAYLDTLAAAFVRMSLRAAELEGRVECLEIAEDLVRFSPPSLAAMRDATHRCVELPGTNIVVLPCVFDRREGGAA